jgi:hypothetical protein
MLIAIYQISFTMKTSEINELDMKPKGFIDADS